MSFNPMDDAEQPLRAQAMSLLANHCAVSEESPVNLLNGRRGRVDVLAHPRDPALSDFTIAFEMKSVNVIADGGLSKWVRQAFDYIGSCPENGWPAVAASFLWWYQIPMDEDPEEYRAISGIMQLAQQFNVGRAVYEPRNGLVLAFGGGGTCVFRAGREGWTRRARALITGDRQVAGVSHQIHPTRS